MDGKNQAMHTTAERGLFLSREDYAALSWELKIAYLRLAIRAVAAHVNELITENAASPTASGTTLSSSSGLDVGS